MSVNHHFEIMSRLPRTLQRIIYRHRRSISLGYSQLRQFSTAVATVPQTQTVPTITHLNMHALMNESNTNNTITNNNNPFMFKLTNMEFNKVNNDIDTTNYIEFHTFNHPTIGLDNFQKHLKTHWNFIPKKSYQIKQENVIAMEFEHESQSPIYPTILVNQLNYDQLSNSTQTIINDMIDTIPNHINPSKNENFLVSGRIWDAITIEEFDTMYKESRFAATLSAFGIFPKQTATSDEKNTDNEAMHASLSAVSFKNGMKMVHHGPFNEQPIFNHDSLNVRKSRFHQKSANNIFRSFLAGI